MSITVRCMEVVAGQLHAAEHLRKSGWEALCRTGAVTYAAPQVPLASCLGWPMRRYFDYVNFNATGYRPYVTTLYAVLLGCARKTISRILVLIVSMGYGVVLPYLGAIQHKVEFTCFDSVHGVLPPYLGATQHKVGPIHSWCVIVDAVTLGNPQL